MTSNGKLKFDLSQITVREMSPYYTAARVSDVETMASVWAQIITDCPKSWGKPDSPDTYATLPFYGEFQEVREALNEYITAHPADVPEDQQCEYNLMTATARQMGTFAKALRESDFIVVAKILASVVTFCPWGEASDEETYLNLRYYHEFQIALKGLNDAVKKTTRR